MNGGWQPALREFFARFSVFKRTEPIASAAQFGDFLATRAAFVSQKKLYEYVKTRMGISYPRHFQDADFIVSLDIAKWHVYAAALSDLAIWMAGQAYKHTLDSEEAAAIARYWHDRTVEERFDATIAGGIEQIRQAFANRVALADWEVMSQRDHAFTLSPKELVRWAPIADRLKQYDVEVVENSIRFSWVAIRQDFNHTYNHAAFIADWRENYAGGA